MIIDIHTHCFPDKLAQRAIAQLAAKADHLKPNTDGTITDLKRSMTEAKIKISVIQNIATNPAQVQNVNNFAISSQDSEIIPFGSIHPQYNNYKDEIKRLKDNGIKGIKLHPDYQDFFVDDESVYPIYNAIFETGLVLLFHAGIDVGLPEPVHCPPSRLLNMYKNFRDAKVIAAHMGGYDMWNDVLEYLTGTGIRIDTSCVFEKLSNVEMTKLIKIFGVDFVHFGTDSPWYNQKTEVQKIQSLDLSDEDKNKILYKNSEKLLELKL